MTPTAGLGFKPQHFTEALACPADGLWFEVHAENYMVAGGPRLAMLDALRDRRPVSIHGVGLSLASDAPPDPDHLQQLTRLVNHSQPFLVSEHLAWSRWQGQVYPDLLPFPRSHQALARIVANVGIVQDALERQILIENPSLYLALDGHYWSEVDFLLELVRRSGCGLLLDVNNVHVSASNLGYDAIAYLNAIPAEAIGEIHLAGHCPDAREGGALLIDSHDAAIAEEVWGLYDHLLHRVGTRPTLIERDDNIPAFAELMRERERAAALLAWNREPAHA